MTGYKFREIYKLPKLPSPDLRNCLLVTWHCPQPSIIGLDDCRNNDKRDVFNNKGTEIQYRKTSSDTDHSQGLTSTWSDHNVHTRLEIDKHRYCTEQRMGDGERFPRSAMQIDLDCFFVSEEFGFILEQPAVRHLFPTLYMYFELSIKTFQNYCNYC